MKYGYAIRLIQEDDGERCWVAKSTSLDGCIGTGDTQEEAVRELEENEAAWLETAEELGLEIPPVPVETAEEEYKGKFTVRTSPFEHKRIAEQARKQGLSLNQYVNMAIAAYNATIASTEYITEAVAEAAREIGKHFRSGVSYTSSSIPAMTYPSGKAIQYSYKQ